MLQLEYFLGSVSMNLETFLGFSLVLSFSPLGGDTLLTCILDGSVGREQASHLKGARFESCHVPKISLNTSIKYQPRNVSSYS